MTMTRQRSALVVHASPALSRQAGFGLVELMVSMLIGLVIIGALVSLFVNSSGNNRELARANSMIENGRFAIKDLPPGEYYLSTVTEVDQEELQEAKFLEELIKASIKISIGEGEKKVQDLRIGGS